MKKILYKLKSYYENQATDIEKPVIRYILENTREVIEMDIHTLAKKGYCSAATIVRIAKKNGLDGFKSMKLALINDLNFDDELVQSSIEISSDDDINSIVSNIFNEHIKSLNNTYKLIDFETIEDVIKLLKKAKVIRLFGIGASYLVAKDFQQKLERINKVSILYEDLHMQLISSNNASEDDLSFVISYSGQTKEIIEICKNLKKHNSKFVAITKYQNNKVMSLADYSLYVPNIEGEIRLGAGSSRITQLTMIDLIYNIYYLREKNKLNDKILSTQKMLEKLKD